VIRATATLRCASRALSTMPARTAMTLEQAMMSGHLIVSELKTPTMVSALQSVRQGDKLSKWQQANAVLIQCTLRALPQIGMTQDARGLHMYTESFAEISRSELAEERDALQGLNAQKWNILLEETFECKPAPPMDLAKARAIAIDMVDALQDPMLHRQMEESRTGIASRLSESERQQLVARAVLGVQSDVIAAHGFGGDAGYAQAQVCLMEHAADAVVTASVAAATTTLYARGGINLQEALQQAMGGA